VGVALTVVHDRLLLDRVGGPFERDRPLARRARRQDRRLQSRERDTSVAAGDVDEVVERLVRDLDALLGETSILVGQGVLEERPYLVG
jgi:alkanesulfonate monooxygenase SsuD/methylene tetrahydromethanopterin reductase-like flavin-dependent oxidoreductase (luciferase family)